jgi:glyoxylase-like metal-dependent hydrolase (beta-lactamase superfamily II)
LAEDDVFFGVGGERNFPPVLERVTLVIQFGEEFDDLRAVFAARFDQYCRAETLQQRAQLVHDDQLIPFDVALDEIEPLQPGEKLAAAPHPGGESDGALSGGIAHEVSSRAEITRFAGGVVAHGDLFILGHTVLRVIRTPGHTPGHVSLYEPESKSLFTGDTLFRESIGRTDLPGGDYSWIMRSILDNLLPLGDEVRVYPGHGPETTIGHEVLYNPFVTEVLNQEVNYKN